MRPTLTKARVSKLALTASYCVMAVASAFAAPVESTHTPEKIDFFEKKIRPILVSHCYNCHSADTKPAGGLRVDDRVGLLRGGDSGPAVVPGDPENSWLLKRVRLSDPKRRMPKEGALLDETEIADLSAWIRDGVAWPAESIPAGLGHSETTYERLRTRHWSLQPLHDPKTPAVKNTAWPAGHNDRLILAKLEERSLAPVGDADPAMLIRRLSFDLTGLPPAPAEIDSFAKDKSRDAYVRVVDRLLASPRFGERWGRHWLDVARYAESTGPSRNIPYPHAWKYRDYVLDAVNRDIPFNRFIQEQVAGDLLPAATAQERDRLLIATGFLALGPKDVNQRFKERFLMDNVDEQIDTVTRAVLAFTVGCARCHDHKFDPIPTSDYYALAGIFTSTNLGAGVRSKMGGSGLEYYDPKNLVRLVTEAPPLPADEIQKVEAEIAAAKKDWDQIRDTAEGAALGPDGKPKQQAYRLKYEQLQMKHLLLTDPGTRGYAIHGLREGDTIADTAVRIRGEAERLGPVVPRGFLTAFQIPDASKLDPAHSGRLELAAWLTSSQNPLTPRVEVNRIWQHLFGQGFVISVDNFGVTGDRPSHPELLDYLAVQFIRQGWSVKKLVREIVLSRAYRLGPEAPERNREIDPANRLVWRHSPRRLDAEEIRDAILATAGTLQSKPPAGSAAKELRMIELQDNGPEARTINEQADYSLVRSVYLPLLRGLTPKALDAFDPVSQTLVTGQRESTTVPTQALYLLNSQFVRKQSLALAERVVSEEGHNKAEAVRRAYWLTLGRSPSKQEFTQTINFLRRYETSYRVAPPVKTAALETVQPAAASSEARTSAERIAQADRIRFGQTEVEETIQPESAVAAAWMSFAQALYGSAEFRFVR